MSETKELRVNINSNQDQLLVNTESFEQVSVFTYHDSVIDGHIPLILKLVLMELWEFSGTHKNSEGLDVRETPVDT